MLAFDEEACFNWSMKQCLRHPWDSCSAKDSAREASPGHHIAIIELVRSRIDKKHVALLIVFDRLPRKRNMALYEDTGFVSKHDAEQALNPRATICGVIRSDTAARKC